MEKKFKKAFPRLEKYDDIEEIRRKFDCLRNLNSPYLDPSKIQNARFFIIKSTNTEDLHKVILYLYVTLKV